MRRGDQERLHLNMDILKSSNLALRFLIELGALAAVAYWGVHTGQGLPLKIALGVGALLLLAVVWGTFVAPRAAVRLPRPTTFVLGLVILELAALALAIAGQRPLAIAYAVIVALNAVLLLAWQQ
jgi:Protein of unknown function (DUF2568)